MKRYKIKSFYLIPITDSSIYLNNKPLRDILESSHPELIRREDERINILYSEGLDMSESLEEEYEQYVINTKKLYDKMQVPEYLIAYGNDKHAKEIITNSEITAEFSAALGCRRVSIEKAEKYYNDTDYETKIRKYFNYINETNENVLKSNNIYEIEGYIEGKIKNKDIQGDFKGKIKIKKLELKLK